MRLDRQGAPQTTRSRHHDHTTQRTPVGRRHHYGLPTHRARYHCHAAIRSEISQGAVMGSTDEARLLSADMVAPAEERRADMLTRRAYAAVARMKPARKGQRRFFTYLQRTEDDDSNTVYAFFVFRTLEA